MYIGKLVEEMNKDAMPEEEAQDWGTYKTVTKGPEVNVANDSEPDEPDPFHPPEELDTPPDVQKQFLPPI